MEASSVHISRTPSNRKEICPDWRRGPHHHMGLWDIGRLPYRKTVPHRNRPQASGPNPWIKEPRRDVATDTTPSHAPVEIRFLTDHRWHVIQSPCSPAGRSVPYWRGDRFIRPTRIGLPFGLPFGLQHTVWANQRKTRRSLSNTEAIPQPATWPDSTRVPDALKPYWQTKDDLSVVHGLLLKAERIVIPTAISLEMALLYAFAYKRAIKVLRNAEKERKGRCGGQVYWTKN